MQLEYQCSNTEIKVIRESELNRDGHLLYKSRQVRSYADDVDILARGTKELQKTTRRLIDAAQIMRVQINQKESNFMMIGNLDIRDGRIKFQELGEFVYLETRIT